MGIGENRRRPASGQYAGKLGQSQEGALGVEVSVDKTRGGKQAGAIEDFLAPAPLPARRLRISCRLQLRYRPDRFRRSQH